MTTLTVQSIESTSIKGSAFVKGVLFFVADEAGQLVGRKGHSSEAEAQAELTGLADYARGLEFARAQFPELGDKAHVGKANVIADFFAWENAGKPVKEAKAAGEVAEESPVADEENPQAF